jgi:hypothetical protein
LKIVFINKNIMKNIEQYRKRFNMLIESSIGDVRPLILEQETPSITASEISVYGPKDREIKNSIKTGGNGFFNVQVTNESLFKITNVFGGGQSDKKFSLGQNPSTDKNLNAINVTYINTNLKKGDSVAIVLIDNEDIMGEKKINKSATASFDGINGFVITFSNINYGEYSIRSIINGRYETENAVYFTITNPNPEPEVESQAENGENPWLEENYCAPLVQKGYKEVSEINLPDGEYTKGSGGYEMEINQGDTPTGYVLVVRNGIRGMWSGPITVSGKKVDEEVYKIFFKTPQ